MTKYEETNSSKSGKGQNRSRVMRENEMQPYGRAKEIERNENGEDTRRKKMKNCIVLLEFWRPFLSGT